jgi:hypothetical protein
MTAAAHHDELHLLGLPSMADYVERVIRRSVGGDRSLESALIDKWVQAAQHRERLAVGEAGLADHPPLGELPASLAPWVEQVVGRPRFAAAFSSVPIALAMVEIDRLVVWQQHLSLDHAARFQTATLDEAAVAAICLPLDEPVPEVTVLRQGDRFVIESNLADLRSFDPQWLDARTLPDLESGGGQVIAGVALGIGYGVSAVNVVRMGQRLVLNNGYHRVYALRRAGVTHLPCVVQAIRHPEELRYAGAEGMVEDQEMLFHAPRPALFKDFFDPRLTHTVRMATTRRQIQITVTVDTLRAPA